MSNVTFKPIDFDTELDVGFKIEEGDLKPVEDTKETETAVKPIEGTTEEKEITPSVSFGENDKDLIKDDFLEKSDKKNKKENVLDVFGSEEEREEEAVKGKQTEITPDYKALTDYYIDKGIFKDFEGREDFEYSEENFLQLLEAQNENTVKEKIYGNLRQSGETAVEIYEFFKNGGTPESFTNNYSQQLEISALDTSTEDGQERAIKEYYKSLDWSDTRIKKHLERVKDSGDEDFKEEADDCKSKLISAIEAERKEMLLEQEQIAEEKRYRVESFKKSIRSSIFDDNTSADREKKELDKFYFSETKEDKHGNRYTDFMVKQNEIFGDPKKFAKYIKFIKNFDSFEDKKVTEKETKAAGFNFLKTGQQPFSNVSSKEPIKQKSEKIKPLKFYD